MVEELFEAGVMFGLKVSSANSAHPPFNFSRFLKPAAFLPFDSPRDFFGKGSDEQGGLAESGPDRRGVGGPICGADGEAHAAAVRQAGAEHGADHFDAGEEERVEFQVSECR